MEVLSIYKFARVSAFKARDVAREIQGLPVNDALDVLNYTPRKAAFLIGKTLRSAIANAENNHDLLVDSLVVKEATVGEGPTFKRYKPRARGSAGPIRKRTSHIRIILTDDVELEEEAAPAKKEKPKKAAPAEAKSEEKPKAEPAPAEAAEETSSAPEGSMVDPKLGLIYTSAPADSDDLKEISGVGPELEKKLNAFGVYKFSQIKSWDADQIAAFDDLLSFKGRIERDNWIDQATELSK